MASVSPNFNDWIEVSEDPAHHDIFFLGPADSRITFYSQQVRALHLVHALAESKRLQPNDRIAVLGAGAAGITAALALASVGVRVELIERATDVLQLQSGSPRLLHPNIYNWPHLGSLRPDAVLPFLDWSQASGQTVRDRLTKEFHRSLENTSGLKFKSSHALTALTRNGNEWTLTLSHEGKTFEQAFDKVILALGFGDERTIGQAPKNDYWKTTGVGSPALEVGHASYFVSGNGDGGLTDLMALLITGFSHSAFTTEFLDLYPRPDLAASVMQAETGISLQQDVEPNYIAGVLPLLELRGVIEHVAGRLRKDRSIVYNTNGPLLAKGKAARLNQVMAFTVLEAAKTAGVKISRSGGNVSAVTKEVDGFHILGPTVHGNALTASFKEAILRHGPDTAKRYSDVATFYNGYVTHMKSLFVANPKRAEPPQLNPKTFIYFDRLFSEAFLDLQSKQARATKIDNCNFSLLIAWDIAAQIPTQQGQHSLTDLANACEQLPRTYTLQLNIAPQRLQPHHDILWRLARASHGRLQLVCGTEYSSDWNTLDSAIVQRPIFTSPYDIRELPTVDALWNALDSSLLRQLDAGLDEVLSKLTCRHIGAIHPAIGKELKPTWDKWRTLLEGDATIRRDFLKIIVRVEPAGPERWDGDTACIPHLVAALVFILATHEGEPLLPASCAPGNLHFADTAVAIGSGCTLIDNTPIADFQDHTLWNVDAMILSGAAEEMFADPGLVSDGGTPAQTLLRPSRVHPVVIQGTRIWRKLLESEPTQWRQAVILEFDRWRARQDAQFKGLT